MMLVDEVRSEFTRSRRRGVLIGWLGLTAVFAALVGTLLPGIVADGPGGPATGPGVSFPSLTQLQGSDGLTAGLSTGAAMFGVITLAFWAVLTASDHSTGLIRLLASAQPRRWRLLVGKVLALTVWTAVATVVALVVTLGIAPAAASSAGVDTSAWSSATPGAVVTAAGDLFLTLLVWGVIGLVLATLTRSAAIAVSVGAGYVLVVEGVLSSALGSLGDHLPGATLTALAAGGTATVTHATALLSGAAYVVVGLGAALVVLTRRDITD
ncbi:hypothetical protein [Kineococcus rubinsiae]|uniref:hypothetical protein n=1 Tax=Kineococcus rubinsiae TaxID=2609562 RepID=UPI00142F7D81|nr:hypothetical protein [Kineococcus rubinsiae]NIZ91941.1 hypothetical protein [Kineococcus rubinsiae]